MSTALDISRHLLCPVCKALLADPLSTSCGHTFCRSCLESHFSLSETQCPVCEEPVSSKPSVNAAIQALLQELQQSHTGQPELFCGERGAVACDVCDEQHAFRAVKSCLTCLLSFCERHLKQHQSMARFRGHRLVGPVETLDQRACGAHGRPLELYCLRDERCICALCVKTGGDVTSVETEREKREAEQQNTIEEVERMISKRENKLEELKESAAKCQAVLELEQEQIKQAFAAAMEALRRSERMLLSPLRDGARSLEKEMDEKMRHIQQDVLKFRQTIDSLNHSKSEEDDILFLQSYPCVPAELKDDWTVSIETELNFGTMRNIRSALMAEIESYLEKLCTVEIRRIQSFSVDVTLDADTAHPHLQVTTDRKAVRDMGEGHNIPGSPQSFDLVGGILGKPSISSGRAFWMVQVGQKEGWELGVMRDGANRKGKISYKPSEGYWALVLCAKDMYGAFEDPPIRLQLSSKPQTLGVFVDFDEALVSFYDMEARSHIYSFTRCSFSGAVRPYFNPHPNKDGNNSSPLVICPVHQTEEGIL